MTESTKQTDEIKRMSMWSYLYAELNRGYHLDNDEEKFTEKRKRVQMFIRIPLELEKFMTYGFFQCLDAFLYIFTFLPIRFIMALCKLCVKGCMYSCISKPGRILEPAQICDLLKGFILLTCCVMMQYVDVSMMYHIVRGQSIIKLYIFFNMLEVFDRLFSSFGQDILDSLFWTATERRDKKRDHFGIIPHMLMALVYCFLHAGLVLFQATTLNVAFNSHNKALLTIMMSNNFVELKGSVFKKFEKSNLFQMSCSDVRERFLFVILLLIVCMRNMTEFSWNLEHLWVLVPDVLLVLGSEILVDWIKHAFITKFNEIPCDVYKEYTVSIAYDMVNSRQKNAFSDHLDLVSRRMGFIPLPLAALIVRVIGQSIRIQGTTGYVLCVIFYLCILTLKVLISIILLGMACTYIDEKRASSIPTSTPGGATSTPVTLKPNLTQDDINIGTKTPTKEMNDMYKQETLMKLPSKEDLDSRSRQSSLSEDNLILDEPCLNRSQSYGDRLSHIVEDLEPSLGLSPSLGCSPSLNRSPSITPKPLFSNSTVSLASVSLNEEFILRDTCSEGKASPSRSELRQRKKDDEKDKYPQKPLSEVDRFSMVSNRIV